MILHDLIRAHVDSPIRVTEDRTRAALALLDLIPAGVPQPRLFIAIDGEVAFIWEDATKCLVLVPQTDGRLRFSAEFGRERRQGNEIYVLALPLVVCEMLNAFRILN